MLLNYSEIDNPLTGTIYLPISKSLCNRALILAALSQDKISIQKISDANDSLVLERSLNSIEEIIDIEDAGTAMRFLTAYFAFRKKSVEIKGTARMHKRPIGVLVNALNRIGASISYLKEEGFPPLRIDACETDQLKSEISITAQTSSQFISALMLIAPSLPNGLIIHLTGKVASRPYIEMTNKLLQKTGVKSEFKEANISVPFHNFESQTIDLESDWSAASYFYAIAALSSNANIQLTNLNLDSTQGDAILVEWFSSYFGISSSVSENGVILSKTPNFQLPSTIHLDFSDYPDLAQTLAVLCACLGVRLIATGLESLLIKETNRINALSTELKKLGVTALTTTNSIEIDEKIQSSKTLIEIKTYSDHRMAMAFSMVALIRPITFDNEKVVSKSFPQFFSEFGKLVSD